MLAEILLFRDSDVIFLRFTRDDQREFLDSYPPFTQSWMFSPTGDDVNMCKEFTD